MEASNIDRADEGFIEKQGLLQRILAWQSACGIRDDGSV